jgi:hypothetical protein
VRTGSGFSTWIGWKTATPSPPSLSWPDAAPICRQRPQLQRH